MNEQLRKVRVKFRYALCVIFIGMSVTTSVFALDLSDVPHASDQIKESIVKEFNELEKKCRKSYTVAISKSGQFWGSNECKDKSKKKERQRRILEICEHKSQEPCGIVVSGGRVKKFKESDQTIHYPETLAISKIPFISNKARKQLDKHFKESNVNIALALNRGGGWGISKNKKSSAEAINNALDTCEWYDNDRSRCFIYALGWDVVFDRSTNIYPERDVRTPETPLDLSDVPYLSDRSKESIIHEYNKMNDRCRKSYTVAITKSGNFANEASCRAEPNQDSQRAVLEVCEHMTKETCGIVVFNGEVTEFLESDQNILYPESFVASMIPFVSDEDRKQLGKGYQNAKGHKALALTPDGVLRYSHNWSSSAKAKKSALELCENFARLSNRCFIYAVGSDVVFDKSTNITPKKD